MTGIVFKGTIYTPKIVFACISYPKDLQRSICTQKKKKKLSVWIAQEIKFVVGTHFHEIVLIIPISRLFLNMNFNQSVSASHSKKRWAVLTQFWIKCGQT